jgi:hypothetical protein
VRGQDRSVGLPQCLEVLEKPHDEEIPNAFIRRSKQQLKFTKKRRKTVKSPCAHLVDKPTR